MTRKCCTAHCLRVQAVLLKPTRMAGTGPARTSFHGVPRVLLSRPAEQLCLDSVDAVNDVSAGIGLDRPLEAAMTEFVTRARINVSIRQITHCGAAHHQAADRCMKE